jgi:uncharacterized membrane protein YphA (DoxX/SURF4 family)
LTHVWLPHTDTIAPMIAVAHLVVGLALVLGVCTRLTAGIALVLLANYLAAAGSWPFFESDPSGPGG